MNDQDLIKQPPDYVKATLIGIGMVLFGVFLGVAIGTRSPSTVNRTTADDANHSASDEARFEMSTYADPRDRRWDSVAGRQVISGMAEEAGVSQGEMRRLLNDEVDRRGLSDWADRN